MTFQSGCVEVFIRRMDTIASIDASERILQDAAAELELVALTFAPANPPVEARYRLERLDQLLVQMSAAQSMILETAPDATSWAFHSRVAHARAWRHAAQTAFDFSVEALQTGADSSSAAQSCCRYSQRLLAALLLLSGLAAGGEDNFAASEKKEPRRARPSVSIPLWDEDLQLVLKRVTDLRGTGKRWTSVSIARTAQSLKSALHELETFIDGLWRDSLPWHQCRYYVEAEGWRIAAQTAIEYIEQESSRPVAQLRPALESAAAFTEESVSALLAPSTRFQSAGQTAVETGRATGTSPTSPLRST